MTGDCWGGGGGRGCRRRRHPSARWVCGCAACLPVFLLAPCPPLWRCAGGDWSGEDGGAGGSMAVGVEGAGGGGGEGCTHMSSLVPFPSAVPRCTLPAGVEGGVGLGQPLPVRPYFSLLWSTGAMGWPRASRGEERGVRLAAWSAAEGAVGLPAAAVGGPRVHLPRETAGGRPRGRARGNTAVCCRGGCHSSGGTRRRLAGPLAPALRCQCRCCGW